MAYIEVDIDISEFETYELVDEIVRRMKINFGSKKLTDRQKQDFAESIKDAAVATGIYMTDIPNKTLEDR